MTREEIREIVRITIEELTAKSTISYPDILRIMNKRLYIYFKNHKDDELRGLLSYYSSHDPYTDIIYLHYCNKQTIEQIAEEMSKDVSTIKRNKKRIIIKMYEELYK